MLTRAGFGDDFGLAHPLRQQCLTQHLVGLVRAAVQQIFTLKVQGGVGSRGNVLAFGQRGRPA